MKDPDVKSHVNVMNEKVTLTVSKEEDADRAVSILKTTKYHPIGSPLLISGNADNHRTIAFVVDKSADIKALEKELGD
jgi:hypothetical protein